MLWDIPHRAGSGINGRAPKAPSSPRATVVATDTGHRDLVPVAGRDTAPPVPVVSPAHPDHPGRPTGHGPGLRRLPLTRVIDWPDVQP